MEKCRKSKLSNRAYRGSEVSNYGNFLTGYPWPPKSYTCCFCKRELRSAQALGGHMNVHRRDRAKLRESLSPHSWESACDTNRLNIPDLNIVPPASSISFHVQKDPKQVDRHLSWKNKEDARLDEDLDLELRLGYA